MENSSKRKQPSKTKLKGGRLSIPWYKYKRLPASTILEIDSDDKIIGIKIKGKYYKVENKKVLESDGGSLGTNTKHVKLNAAIPLNDKKQLELSSIKNVVVEQEASEPDKKKEKLDKKRDRVDEEGDKDDTKKPNTDPTGEREERSEMEKRDKPATDTAPPATDTAPPAIDTEQPVTTSREGGAEEGEGDPVALAEEKTIDDMNKKNQEDLPVGKSVAPSEKVPPPSASGRELTQGEIVAWENYQIWKGILDKTVKTGDTDHINATMETAGRYFNVYEERTKTANLDYQPPGLKEVQESDDALREEEKKQAVAIADKKGKEVEERKDSAVLTLAAGEANETTDTDVRTGHRANATIAHNVDVDVTMGTSSTTPGQVNERQNVVNMEKENSDANNIEQIVLSAQVEQLGEVDKDEHAASGNTTNINTVVPPKEDEEMTEAITTKEKKDGKVPVEFTRKETKNMDQERGTHTQFKDNLNTITGGRYTLGQVETGPKGVSQERIDQAELEQEQTGRNIPGFDDYMLSLQRQGLVKSALDLEIRRKELDALRQLNKISDVSTASMLTPEQVQAVIDKDSLERARIKFSQSHEAGQNELATPVFSPDTSRSYLHEAQRTVVAHMTQEEADTIRKRIKPFWDEYKLVRINQGVMEMSTMPTNLLKSDHSTLRAASKIRGDVSQRENSFGHFMFYILHHKMDISGTTWGELLRISAALGYNDLTKAQINWLITGNPNGDLHDSVDFSRIEDEGSASGALNELINITKEYSMKRIDSDILHEQVRANPEPQTQYPSRSMTPSAGSVDNSTHPNGTTSLERQQQSTLSGLPSSVFNIPDPRFSMRGGEEIENVREVTVRNEKWSPNQTAKEGEPGYEPKFTKMTVPDIGVGSGDIQAQVNQASADRLLNMAPFKLYAPIHPQACDRYLGVRNYKRLNTENSQYMKEFSEHPFNETDTAAMYMWNSYVMGLYGPVLYSNVTDIAMQRDSPVFDISTPDSVVDEYKELNELIKELTRFQERAEDRADRVNGGAQEERPLEKEIGKLFHASAELDKQKISRANAMIISFPDDEFPSGGGGHEPVPIDPLDPNSGGDMPGPVIPGNDPINPAQLPDFPPLYMSTAPTGIKSTKHPLVGPIEMDQGIIRANSSKKSLHSAVRNQALSRTTRHEPVLPVGNDETSKRIRMFQAFSKR